MLAPYDDGAIDFVSALQVRGAVTTPSVFNILRETFGKRTLIVAVGLHEQRLVRMVFAFQHVFVKELLDGVRLFDDVLPSYARRAAPGGVDGDDLVAFEIHVLPVEETHRHIHVRFPHDAGDRYITIDGPHVNGVIRL